jgi:formyl-CoA transferase
LKTKDGYINIAANKQEQWEAVTDVLGVPELKTDHRFQERDTRKKNRKELTLLLEARLQQQETAFWVEALNARDVPSGAILTLDGAMKQAQVEHRNTFRHVSMDGIGEIPLFNMTAKFSATPGTVETPPPKLGEHTEEVLRGIGYSTEQVRELKSKGVI